jgi:hypothetical protein
MENKVEKKPLSLSSMMMIMIVKAWARGIRSVGYGSCDINNRAWQ